MRMRWVAGILVWLFMAVGAAVPQRETPTPPTPTAWWPIPVNYGITSHFGDFRWAGRLHTGVDLSTNLRIGLPVRVWKEGRIVRIRVDRRGYGRALYVAHPDGTTTVYAHLDRFENRRLHLEDRVAAIRRQKKAWFFGSVSLNPGIPVQAHQVIGYTGESGSGLPHLHFEIRTAQQVPLNPLEHGLMDPYDRQRPVIQGIILVPASATTLIQGRPEPLVVANRGERRVERLTETITLTGPVELWVAAYDPTFRPAVRSPHRLEVRLDGTLRYRWNPRRVAFEEWNRTGFVYWLGLGVPKGWTTPLRITHTGQAPPGMVVQAWEGPLDPSPGLHWLSILASDTHGATAEFHVRLLRIPTPLEASPHISSACQWVEFPPVSFFSPLQPSPVRDSLAPVQVRITLHGIVWSTSRASVWRIGPSAMTRSWICQGLTCVRQHLWETPVPTELPINPAPAVFIVTDLRRHHRFRFQRFTWEIPPGGLWRRQALWAIPTVPPSVPEGLIPLTPAYRMEPAFWSFRRMAILTWTPPPTHRFKPIGLFAWHPHQKRWLLLGSPPDAFLRASIRQPLLVMVAEDQAPPRIVRKSPLVWNTQRWPMLRIRVNEEGLGIREDRIHLLWDGQWVEGPETVFYDPDWRAVVYRPPTPPAPGWHTVELFVEDWAGLSDRARIRVHVRP